MSGKGTLSSRVLSMKFMKAADQAEKEKDKEEQLKKLQDESEWSLSSSQKVINRMKAQKRRIKSVGYSTVTSSLYKSNSINQDTSASEESSNIQESLPIGRRKFGTEEPKSEEPTKNSKSEDTGKRTIEDNDNGIVYQEDSGDESDESASKPTKKPTSLMELWAANKSQKKRPNNIENSNSNSSKSNKRTKKNKE